MGRRQGPAQAVVEYGGDLYLWRGNIDRGRWVLINMDTDQRIPVPPWRCRLLRRAERHARMRGRIIRVKGGCYVSRTIPDEEKVA
jgi:hypothetical protein